MKNDILIAIVKMFSYVALFASCITFFSILQKVGYKTKNVGAVARAGIDNVLKKHGKMTKYKQKMSKLGVMYRAGDYNLNPSWFVMTKLAVGTLVSLLIGLLFGKTPFLFLGIPLGYFATDFYFSYKNTEDNKAIMMDLYNTYSNLKIQMEAGLYIVDSLEYSHKIAQNKRYKEALGELIINFSDKTIPMVDAVEIYKNRFDSREIDKLCSLLNNCILYGMQAAYTKDIMNEIQGIILANAMASEHDIESKAGIVNFTFFAIIIFATVYAVFTNFNNMNLFM